MLLGLRLSQGDSPPTIIGIVGVGLPYSAEFASFAVVAYGRAGEHGVGTRGIYLRGAFANQSLGGFYQSARGIDDVVDNQGAAAAHKPSRHRPGAAR